MRGYFDDDIDDFESECLICGDEAYGYLLCKDCYYAYKNEKILIELTVTPEMETKLVNKLPTKQANIDCLICGENSNGKHFCSTCYNKYKNKAIDIRIENCTDISIIDKYGNLKYKCKDGRYVRSLQEQTIANTLWDLDIKYVYEEQVSYYEEKTIEKFFFEPEWMPDTETITKTLHPDFYLPQFNIYIEHMGFKSKEHYNSLNYKKKIYEKQGLNVIITTHENLTDFKNFIKTTLKIK